MTWFIGTKALLAQIDSLLRSGQHVSIVGPRSMGKTALLQEVVTAHAGGSEIFAGAALVDFRHSVPGTMDVALRRVAEALCEILAASSREDLAWLAGELDTEAEGEELYDKVKLTLDYVASADARILLVLDGCDPV